MARYACSFAENLSTSQGTRTITSTAAAQGSSLKVFEIYIAGEASSSSVSRFIVNRLTVAPTGAATNGGVQALDPASITNAFLATSLYATTQGTLSAFNILTLGFNAFGGVVRWVAAPDSEVIVGTQGAVAYLVCRSASGTSPVSGHILVEER